MNDGNIHNLKLILISNRSIDGRIYNQPTISEVVTLIGHVDTTQKMQTKGRKLQ